MDTDATGLGEIELGHFEAGLELDEQPLRGALPHPGTSMSAARSSSSNARRRPLGECADNIANASFGPTPVVPISASNVSRSSRDGKPYNTIASSRTCRCVKRKVVLPGSSTANVPAGTCTR